MNLVWGCLLLCQQALSPPIEAKTESGDSMEPNQLFLLQLLGAVTCGGFVGEFHRASTSANLNLKIFMANFLAGSFLSFILAYLMYLATEQRQISIVVGAIFSYQEEKFISRFARNIIRFWLNEGEK